MSIIRILSEKLINQIAAGEVIERPASCVKELVENSIDAGASQITIEIKNSGTDYIKISDNGCGMSRDDAKLSLLRHATSKIHDEKDLWNIRTMGFRGEALASIAAVSKFYLRTKNTEGSIGTEIYCEGGETKVVQDCGMGTGTEIEISDLFFNTPARQRYLKKESTELEHIATLLNTIALANPEISFTLINNGKVSFKLPRSESLERRIADIFGSTTKEAMIPLFYGGTDFGMSGFIGKPVISRSGSKHQYIFVNKRPITHNLIAYKIKDAFRSLLMEGKNPVFIINISIDPTLIDVNVHPRKLEIRFEDQSRILAVIYESVKNALEKTSLMPKGFTESRRYMSDSFPKYDKDSGLAHVDGVAHGSALAFGRADIPQNQPSLDIRSESSSLKAVTQVSNSYIVAQDENGLVLVDQHAAHERVRFFELLDQFNAKSKRVQPLLMPENLELAMDDLILLKNNLDVFEGLGFEIQEGPGNGVTLYSVPAVLSSEDIVEIVNGVLDDIRHSDAPKAKQGKSEMILHYMSCRSAIKFGQKLSIDEMDTLLSQLQKIDRPYTCPHGRPTMISLSFSELERMFGRK